MTYEWDTAKKSQWLLDQLRDVDPQDFDARVAVATEYSQRFGWRVQLVRCRPEYGPGAGQFWGYNITEMCPGEGVFFEGKKYGNI